MASGHAQTPPKKRQRTSPATPTTPSGASNSTDVKGYLSGVTVGAAEHLRPSRARCARCPAVPATQTGARALQVFFVKRSFDMFSQRLKVWRPKLEAAGAAVAEARGPLASGCDAVAGRRRYPPWQQHLGCELPWWQLVAARHALCGGPASLRPAAGAPVRCTACRKRVHVSSHTPFCT